MEMNLPKIASGEFIIWLIVGAAGGCGWVPGLAPFCGLAGGGCSCVAAVVGFCPGCCEGVIGVVPAGGVGVWLADGLPCWPFAVLVGKLAGAARPGCPSGGVVDWLCGCWAGGVEGCDVFGVTCNDGVWGAGVFDGLEGAGGVAGAVEGLDGDAGAAVAGGCCPDEDAAESEDEPELPE